MTAEELFEKHFSELKYDDITLIKNYAKDYARLKCQDLVLLIADSLNVIVANGEINEKSIVDCIDLNNFIKENVFYKVPYLGNIKLNRVGEKYTTNEGYTIEIIEYTNKKDCTIQFEDGTTIKNLPFGNIKRGNIRNPYRKSVCGVGYMGEGKYKSATKVHSLWNSMFKRAYSGYFPTYKNVTVCEEWYNFQNFAKWFEKNWKPYMDSSWHLDKDILIKNNKVYSPQTCCFVPREINILFIKANKLRGDYPIGVSKYGNNFQAQLKIKGEATRLGDFSTSDGAFQAYKTAKEQHIKNVAEEWKDKIDPRVYEVMYNYKVEITD